MRILTSLALLLTTLNVAAENEKSNKSCAAALQSSFAEHSYDNFADIQKQKAAQHGAKLPEFTDPREERSAQQTWAGVPTPELFKKLLPEGVSFVSHSLRKADAGFVKSAGTGDAVILRVSMPYKNRTYSTNVAVPVSALIDNMNRKDKWLVGPEASACIDWGHGGGTKDTGEHTAFGPMNYFLKFGITVMGQAQPWHSEGDRDFTDTPEEYLTELRQEFLKRFVHPDVPVFGVGHSMGGLFADMQWRRLGKKSRYKGFVSLSGVVDDCPGCSPQDKLKSEIAREELQKRPEYFQRLAPGDQRLSVDLVKQLKISALSMFFTQYTELAHDWSKLLPEDQRVPILYVWGEGDFLYVGNEERIKKLRELKNVQVVTYGPRVEFSGSVENVGHLIFDHWRTLKDSPHAVSVLRNYLNLSQQISLDEVKTNFKDKVLKTYVHPYSFLSEENNSADALLMSGYYYSRQFKEFVDALIQKDFNGNKKEFFHQFVQKETPETFVLVKEMMEKTLNKKIDPREIYSAAVKDNSMLLNLAYRYANDLVAREVYQGLVLKDVERKSIAGVGGEGSERFPLDKISERLKILNEAAGQLQSIAKQKKNKKLDQNQEKEAITKILDSYRIKLSVAQGKRTDVEWTTEALIKQRDALNAILSRQFVFDGPRKQLVEDNVKKRAELKKQLTQLGTEKKKLSKDLKDLTRQLTDKEKRFEKLLDSAHMHKDGHLAAVYQLSVQLEKQLDQLMVVDQEVRTGNAAYLQSLYVDKKMNRESLLNLPPDLMNLYAKYSQETKTYQDLKNNILAEIKRLSADGQLGLEWQTLYTDIFGEEGLVTKIQKLQTNITKLDFESETVRIQGEVLVEEYVEKLVPGFYKVRILAGQDLLNSEYSTVGYKTLKTLTEKIQAVTNSILKDMPPAGATELY